jgi:branched-chain amino acid transport system ATP-binding protein
MGSVAPALALADVEVVYHKVVLVLRGVSLVVPVGGIVALLGPNGAGKTTTLRAITGLLDLHQGKRTKGRVALEGQDIDSLKPDQIVARGVAQVMEGRRVFSDLTVEENLRVGAWSLKRNELAPALEQAFERFPVLGERRRQAAGYLSGGEQQMLAIARALMSRPKLLLLDEPSLGLAPKIVNQVAELIREINASGVSVLLVEQNASVALDLAGHAYLMENGRIVLEGPASKLREDKDVQEFYLGAGTHSGSLRSVKRYRRRKRWLS